MATRKSSGLDPRPRRSALYMPGAKPRALDKARALDTDCLLLDLEDSVAPEVKSEARAQVCAALRAGGYGARELVVRINALATPWGAEDLAALRGLPEGARPHAVLAPKVSTPEEINTLDAALPEAMDLWIMIETPPAIFNAQALAACAAHSKLSCFVMGTNDLAKEMQAALVPGRAPLMSALSLALLAARQYNLIALDGVFNDIANADGLAAECQQGADMGFNGKTLIHPGQLAVCNDIFGPSGDEIEEARAIVRAFGDPVNAGKGVLKVNGKMTELLHRDIAIRKLAIADAIVARQGSASGG